MPTNISRWYPKGFRDFRIPVRAFFSSARKDWHPTLERDGDHLRVEFFSEEQFVAGRTVGERDSDDEILIVEEVDIYGEGSGSSWHYSLEPALRASSGEMCAVVVWEAGEDVEVLDVLNGMILTTDLIGAVLDLDDGTEEQR